MALNVITAHEQQQQQQQPTAAGSSGSSGSSSGGWSADQLHVAIEACRMAFADALAKVADPVVQQELPIEAMLSQQRAFERYKQYFDPAQVGFRHIQFAEGGGGVTPPGWQCAGL
jgi:gamma-glutamyltranspeptidase